MRKKIIKELVLASYTQGSIDAEKVEKIAHMLNRSLLKQYIKALKRQESKLSVLIDCAYPIDDEQKIDIENLFPNKKFIYSINPSLLAGLKITRDDIIFEMTIKGALDAMLEKIQQDYD